MFLERYFVLTCVLISLVKAKSIPQNNSSAELITKYAKVARWGAIQNNTDPPIESQGRSSSGQSLWTHRSDVNIIGGQNLNSKKPVVTYQYPVRAKKPASKVDQTKHSELLPGVGEVIQERFNPRPYFSYEKIPPKSQNPPAPSSPVYKAPVISNNKPPPPDLYTSPYSSYNPPNVKPNNFPLDNQSFPPNAPQPAPPTTQDTYAAPPVDASSGGSYDYKPSTEDSKPSLGPPLAPPDDSQQFPGNGQPDASPGDFPMPDGGDHPPDDSMGDMPQDSGGLPDFPPMADMHHDGHDSGGPPSYPPKNAEDVYYPPDDDNHQPQETILDHPPTGYKPDMGEADLSPPPTDGQGDAKFPQYLYDHKPADFGHDFDHHQIYHEVEPPTTTPQAEDERVNKGHYSYYYLGRKLWYIPLYFSVYFIIYVTILILKSIARHKIDFKHHFDDKRKARGMDLDRIDELHRNVTEGIENVRKKYPYIAM